ncbi:unnamed protein product [Spirodela intermedia]|uniref:Uncharacterized protein n=1 Tax=Spirodela intermedia TaxID=51605 RepID=A0A7I8IP20_SPIIN|nr:unnamed protein product [Spirodela intermedia]CAA6659559.1 unnamed protein product [Spirodela intermedia]
MFRASRGGSTLLSPSIRAAVAAVAAAGASPRAISLLSPLVAPVPVSLPEYQAASGHWRRFSSLNELSSPAIAPAEHDELLPAGSGPPSQESVLYVLKRLGKAPRKAIDFLDCARERYGFKPSGTVYNLMLRILGGSKEWAKDFWIIAQRMREEGHSVDRGTYLTLLLSFKKQGMSGDASALVEFQSSASEEAMADEGIRTTVDLLNAAEEWTEALEGEMDSVKLVLSETNVAKVLREVREHPLKALGFFRWAARRPDYKHGSTEYNAMARVLGREGAIEEFWDLAGEMKREGHDMDIDTYVKLSRRFQKGKMLKEAVQLYEYMMDGPYKPSPQDCGLLLRQISLADEPDLELVFRVVKRYEAHGHSLSKAVYDGIHRSLTSVGRFQEAEQIMEKMKGAGFEPDNITYSQLVYGLCKAKRLEEARRVLDEMEAAGSVPDLKTWTVLIHGHCSVREVDQALTCFTDMIGKGLVADGHLLDAMVKGLCSQGRVSAAYTLVLEMLERADVKPWQATFKLLIESLLGEGKFEEALKLLGAMKGYNFPPHGEPFAPYISKSGTVEDAREFFKAMSAKSSPSSSTYLRIFRSFFEQGRYDEARDLLFKCPHHIRKHSDVSKLFGSVNLE